MKDAASVIAGFPPQVRERYDFSAAAYHGSTKPMTGIVCPQHGVFEQYVAQLRKDGSGCQACGQNKRVAKRRCETSDVIARAQAIHGNKFTYKRTVYEHSAKHVTVTCTRHGDFPITPNNLLRGRGCPACWDDRRDTLLRIAQHKLHLRRREEAK
jgi:hypothetical protein